MNNTPSPARIKADELVQNHGLIGAAFFCYIQIDYSGIPEKETFWNEVLTELKNMK